MKIAIISDIHANPKALRTALDDAKNHGCKRFICLGDIVGYGYDPNACIDICRDENIECVLGNHDAGVIEKLSLNWFSEWAQGGVMRHRLGVDKARKDWLRSLDYQKRENIGKWRCCFSHGTYNRPEEFDYIHNLTDAELVMLYMEIRSECNLLFVGHTHYAEAYSKEFNDIAGMFDSSTMPNLMIDVSKYKTVIVNVGSVGYPRNQPYSYYVIFDTDEQRITYRQLPFDFSSYIAEMEKRMIRIPSWLQYHIDPAKKVTKR